MHTNGHNSAHLHSTSALQSVPVDVLASEMTASRGRAIAKRCLDVAVGVPLAILAIPVIAFLAVAVAVSFREWPFFVHMRIGQGGRYFPFLKLRTLPSGTAVYASKYDLPTVGGLADFLRRTHLDELPQLFLVPLGWMSLVGPRPKMPDYVEPADPEHGAKRVLVPQGCTGLWQLSPEVNHRVVDSPEFDLFYIKHHCIRLDLWILWRTFLKFCRLGTPRALSDVPRWAYLRVGDLPAIIAGRNALLGATSLGDERDDHIAMGHSAADVLLAPELAPAPEL